MSQQLSALEHEIGVTLLTRSGGSRPAELTNAGECVAAHAAAILNRVELLRHDAGQLRPGACKVLRIGTIGSTAVHVLPHALRMLEARGHPASVELTEERSDKPLLDAVERGRLDVTFAQLPLPAGPYEWQHLLTVEYVAIVRADHPSISADPDLILGELTRAPLIAYQYVRPPHDLEQTLLRLGFNPRVVYRTDDNATVQRLVGVGLGVAIVPAIAVDHSDPAIRIVGGLPGLPPFPIGLAWHKDKASPADFIACAVNASRKVEARYRVGTRADPVAVPPR